MRRKDYQNIGLNIERVLIQRKEIERMQHQHLNQNQLLLQHIVLEDIEDVIERRIKLRNDTKYGTKKWYVFIPILVFLAHLRVASLAFDTCYECDWTLWL